MTNDQRNLLQSIIRESDAAGTNLTLSLRLAAMATRLVVNELNSFLGEVEDALASAVRHQSMIDQRNATLRDLLKAADD